MKVFLLQGPPGIGKTTIAQLLVQKNPTLIRHLQLGDYLQHELAGQVADRTEMRSRAPELMKASVVRKATSALRSDIARGLEEGYASLVEVRDVAYRPYGLKGLPTSAALVRGMDCGGIYLLVASLAEVAGRGFAREGKDMGFGSPVSLADYYDLQRAYSAAASHVLDCEFHTVDAEAPAEDVAGLIEVLMLSSLQDRG